MTDGKPTLSVTQAAQVARIAPRNLHRWINDGKLKATKPDSIHWEILTDDLLAALEANPPTIGGRKNRGKVKPGFRPGIKQAGTPADQPQPENRINVRM